MSIHINMDQDQTAAEVHEDLQSRVNSWGKLLIASGGSLKPKKCFLYLISLVWNSSGKWAYESNELKENHRIGVPMTDGSLVDIYDLSVDIVKETLGVFTCPSGDASAQFLSMFQKGQKLDWPRGREPSPEERHLVPVGSPAVASTVIWHMQHFCAMEEAWYLSQESVVEAPSARRCN